MVLEFDMLRPIERAFLGFWHCGIELEDSLLSRQLLRDPSLHMIHELRAPFSAAFCISAFQYATTGVLLPPIAGHDNSGHCYDHSRKPCPHWGDLCCLKVTFYQAACFHLIRLSADQRQRMFVISPSPARD
jgi:hypothetical protein